MSRTTIADLTERKRIEELTLRLNEELERRIAERTSELADANRELKQKNDENEMFVYSVSHDLRSPLINLQGFSAELEKACKILEGLFADPALADEPRQKAKAVFDGKIMKSLGFIRAAVTRSDHIISSLLRLSRAGRVEYRWEKVDVQEVVTRVLDSMKLVLEEKAVEVVLGKLEATWGDATAIEQAFANLIGNATTYLDSTRVAKIEIGCEKSKHGRGIVYFVRDNGLGIAESHRARIFQVFQRAHPGIGSGEGIGLSIVARVAERHRGRVWVESCVGEGSTFYLALQVGREAPTSD
jgi:light-regulated signal transduction histidine kinase (bacteriophytochrome)